MKKIFLNLFFALFAVFSLSAQTVENPVTWTFSSNKISDTEYELIFKASIEPDWSVYSSETPDGGPSKMVYTFKENANVRLQGKVQELNVHKKFDEIFEVDVFYFSNEIEAKQLVKLEGSDNALVEGNIEFQACKDGMCVMFDEDFSIQLGNAPQQKEEQKVEAAPLENNSAAETDDSLWSFFWLAFIGGLAAVIMPCVFPMIPMTVSFFMHSDSNKTKAKMKALFFALSIIAIYTVLGLVIAVFLGPDFINWLSTNWIPNLFFFIIFMIFAASFFGAFEIVLPAWIVNKSDAQADKGGFIGAFFMAFTLVLVSFSCTAPIVGTVLVEAARGSFLRPIIGMLGFSFAVALPFGFFAFFPSKLSSLPKSGGWLNSVKVVLGLIEVALGFKFLMVIDQTYHLNILDREIYIAIWITIFTLQGLYLMGKLKFQHDSDLDYIGIPRLVFIIATFSFVVYLIPGMFGAPLKAFAGYLPPQETIDFDINRLMRENVKNLSVSTSPKGSLCEEPKYADFLHLPHGLEGYFDYEQALNCAKAQNKPLFIDFTGHGCVNCREMEQSVWSDPRILKMLREEYVVVALYVDDKKELPESEWIVSKYDGKTKKTLGKKNADFQIVNFHSNAQPNYILLDNAAGMENMDQHVLMPARGHNLDKDAFYEFLKQGLEEFKKRK